MSPSDSSGTLDPEALAAVGKLRECVAAARNLEHLIGSRDVGPKVLEQVVPDVAAELLPFQEAVVEAGTFVIQQLGLETGTLDGLVLAGKSHAQALYLGLKEEVRTPMNAKRRLAIERAIRMHLPNLSASLMQMELLIEATSAVGVPMSAYELLTSTPDVGSNRPHRRVVIAGPADELQIETPARIGLRCLGILASSIDPEGRASLCLEVSLDGPFVRFSVLQQTPEGQHPTGKLPIYSHTDQSLTTAGAALARFGGRVEVAEAAVLLRLERSSENPS